jgi:hypothetical protein
MTGLREAAIFLGFGSDCGPLGRLLALVTEKCAGTILVSPSGGVRLN